MFFFWLRIGVGWLFSSSTNDFSLSLFFPKYQFAYFFIYNLYHLVFFLHHQNHRIGIKLIYIYIYVYVYIYIHSQIMKMKFSFDTQIMFILNTLMIFFLLKYFFFKLIWQQCVNHIDISDNIIWILQFFYRKEFYWREKKKSTFPYF